MLSKGKIKLIQSLSRKKERDELSLFVAEGDKIVSDLMLSCHCQLLVATQSFVDGHPGVQADEIVVATRDEIHRASALQSPQSAIAVFHKPLYQLSEDDIVNGLTIAIDTVQDPGNLGTIIRLADWFGISDIVCSEATADVYNSKVVQATMGAISRVRVHYTDLVGFLLRIEGRVPVYGTFLDGDDIYAASITQNGVVVMGNEGNGISAEVERCVSKRLRIPSFRPANELCSESLNVAIATAVVCSEFRRRFA